MPLSCALPRGVAELANSGHAQPWRRRGLPTSGRPALTPLRSNLGLRFEIQQPRWKDTPSAVNFAENPPNYLMYKSQSFVLSPITFSKFESVFSQIYSFAIDLILLIKTLF